MQTDKLAVLVVAAGSSSRLGQPKQLVKWNNTTLLEHSISCGQSISKHVFVVLGANGDQITGKISHDHFVHFAEWPLGMGSSIAFGVHNILTVQPYIESIIIMVCDQPFVSADVLKQICDTHFSSQNLITACTYADTIGVPALFSQSTFPDLLNLTGDKGAKAIISKYHKKTGLIEFSEGSCDIDSFEDLHQLSN